MTGPVDRGVRREGLRRVCRLVPALATQMDSPDRIATGGMLGMGEAAHFGAEQQPSGGYPSFAIRDDREPRLGGRGEGAAFAGYIGAGGPGSPGSACGRPEHMLSLHETGTTYLARGRMEGPSESIHGKPVRMPDHPALLSRLSGGDWSLVASLVFKTSDTSKRRVVGSIPIHLRQPLVRPVR